MSVRPTDASLNPKGEQEAAEGGSDASVDKCESNRDIRRSRDTTRGGGGEDLNENRVKESLSFNL